MNREKIYLDTSVPSAYYDERQTERMRVTQIWWKNELLKYDVLISEITTRELGATPDLDKRKKLLKLVEAFPVVTVTSEIVALAEKYLEANIIPKNFKNDALHIAIATIYGANILVSWNFKHLVTHDTRIKVNAVNVLNGYVELKIESPLELGGGKYVG